MTREQVNEKLADLRNSFLTSLGENGIEISPEAICSISQDGVTLGLTAIGKDAEMGYKGAFASELEIHAVTYNEKIGYGRKENVISFGSSGSFSPSERSAYWRTIHAASILKNWDKICPLVNSYCKEYLELMESFYKENNV